MFRLRKSIFGKGCSIWLCLLLVQQSFAFSLFANMNLPSAYPDPVEACVLELVELVTNEDIDERPASDEDLPQNTGGTEEERCESETNEEKSLARTQVYDDSAERFTYHTYTQLTLPGAFCTIFTPPPELG